jgi:putative acetyltransferase
MRSAVGSFCVSPQLPIRVRRLTISRANMHLPISPVSAILNMIRMTELIRPDSPELWQIARTLVREYAASLNVSLDFQNFDDELLHFETEYATPTGAFLLARNEHDFLACGALRRFSATDCEMKRLYVRPSGRNLGLGRQLAVALITEAESLGYKRMLLDTLPTMQSAQSLYKSLGFQPTEPYRYNPIEGTSFLKLEL